MHLCAELTAAFWTLEPFGKVGANFSLQLSSGTRFDRINKKKVIAENQCEKHKKSSLVLRKLQTKLWYKLFSKLQCRLCDSNQNHQIASTLFLGSTFCRKNTTITCIQLFIVFDYHFESQVSLPRRNR